MYVYVCMYYLDGLDLGPGHASTRCPPHNSYITVCTHIYMSACVYYLDGLDLCPGHEHPVDRHPPTLLTHHHMTMDDDTSHRRPGQHSEAVLFAPKA